MQKTPQKKSWLSRNWKWAVPAGCLTICVLWFALIGGGILGLFALMKKSDVYALAMAKVEKSSQVIALTGAPVRAGWYMTGNISVSGSEGEADIAFPVSGPKGGGKVFAVATKSAGKWAFSTLVFEHENGERVYLVGRDPSRMDI